MKATIRTASEDDAAQILGIYTRYVLGSAVSFEVEPPSVSQIQERIASTLAQFPWLVCEREGEVWGYASGSAHRSRAAYQWSVDCAVYIHPSCHRAGVGRGLYTALFGVLNLQGFYNAYAGITLPNPASVGLHESLGFQPVGIYHAVGYKLGAWHDVGWWHKSLRPGTSIPTEPVAFSRLPRDPAWHAALDVGRQLLQI